MYLFKPIFGVNIIIATCTLARFLKLWSDTMIPVAMSKSFVLSVQLKFLLFPEVPHSGVHLSQQVQHISELQF